MGASGPHAEDRLTGLASGLLAGAVLANLLAAGAIWWYRQAALGWTPPSPRVWRLLGLIGIGLAVAALVVSVIAVTRRRTRGGRAGAVAWALTAAVVLVATPTVVGRLAPDGRHAVVVAVDAATGDVRWRVETGGWALRSVAITGDVVTVLTVGGDREPCEEVLRRVTLGLAEGSRLSVERAVASATQAAPPEYMVRGGYLVYADGPSERWRVDLVPLGVRAAKDVVAGSGVVIVTGDGQLPLRCRVPTSAG